MLVALLAQATCQLSVRYMAASIPWFHYGCRPDDQTHNGERRASEPSLDGWHASIAFWFVNTGLAVVAWHICVTVFVFARWVRLNLALVVEPPQNESFTKLMTQKCRFQAACAYVINIAMCSSVNTVCANQLESVLRGQCSFRRYRAPEVRWYFAAAQCNIEVEGCFVGKRRARQLCRYIPRHDQVFR